MKIDMNASAVTLRLKQVNQLRQACLALADSSAGRSIRRKHATNQLVQRTSRALGHKKLQPGITTGPSGDRKGPCEDP